MQPLQGIGHWERAPRPEPGGLPERTQITGAAACCAHVASATLLRHLGATPRPGAPDGAFVVLFQLCEGARQTSAVLYKVTNLPQARSASAMS